MLSTVSNTPVGAVTARLYVDLNNGAEIHTDR